MSQAVVPSVLLVGGGHAHVEVIRRWAEAPPNATLTVVDPNPRPIYSGMAPGYIAGQYRRSDLEIDLERLCGRAQARWLAETVGAIDAKQGAVTLLNGRRVSYDVASIDIGSSVAGMDVPGVAEFALPTRPMPDFLARIDALGEELAKRTDRSSPQAPLLVVGGGAGGVEVAFCLQARRCANGDAAESVEIVTLESRLLARGARSTTGALERRARARGLRVHRDARVARVEKDCIQTDDGRRIPASVVVWVTGPAAHPLAQDSGLPMDERGFIRTGPTLQVEGCDHLFAAGDCANLPGARKAGVYAVRAAPVLDANLRATLSGARLERFAPQDDFLSLINLGDGSAIGTKWGLTLKGRAIMKLKDRIDRAFMEKYQ